MALIVMCCFDTVENGRSVLTERTLNGLSETVNFERHEIIIVNNNSCERTKAYIGYWCDRTINAQAIHLPQNIGTARAINLGWTMRKPSQHVVKIDNDVIINSVGWVDEMESVMNLEPMIGILGLKRKDLIECTTHHDKNFRSVLHQLAHERGERWVIVEEVNGVMGTCKMINHALVDKIGYLSQPTVYGFDDSIYSCRSRLAGFLNCFLPHIDIDHIDPGGTDYTEWKAKHAGETMGFVQQLINEYETGARPIYEAA